MRQGESFAGLPLPFEPPGPEPMAQVPHEPLGKIRAVIVNTFQKDGWRRANERLPAGSHKLTKQTPGGRRLELSFDTGSWSRRVLCMMTLGSARGVARMPIPADRSLRMQYLPPNRRLFAGILENLRVVVAYLEGAWIRELEEALGAVST